jgi:hypothetical protein
VQSQPAERPVWFSSAPEELRKKNIEGKTGEFFS